MPPMRLIPGSSPALRPTGPRAGASSAAAPRPRRRSTLGPSFLAACGGEEAPATARPRRQRSGQRHAADLELAAVHGRRVRRRLPGASGITVDYKEDFNDNEQWFAKVKEPLSRKQDIGADLAVPTTFMAARLTSSAGSTRSAIRLAQQGEPAPGPAGGQRRPGPQVQRALHVRAWSGWPTTGPRPVGTSRPSTICGTRRSRAGSACSPIARMASA